LRVLQAGVDAKAGTADAMPAAARGVAHQLCENFGSLQTAQVTLPADRRAPVRALRPYGVWFGRRSIYLTKLLRPDAAALLALLWGVWTKLENVPALPRPGLTSFVNDTAAPEGFLAAAGFRVVSGRAIRLDMLERLEDVLEKSTVDGGTTEALMPKLVSLLGCGNDELREILAELGWHSSEVADGHSVWRRTGKREPPRGEPQRPVRKDSPFAGLADLIGGK
jgi:ATP-dependent RNA helicase SUPV3L1/SUV3